MTDEKQRDDLERLVGTQLCRACFAIIPAEGPDLCPACQERKQKQEGKAGE